MIIERNQFSEIRQKMICVSVLQDSETFNRDSNSVWLKRRQVLEVWMEIQELEQDLKEKLVSTVTTTATEKHVKDLKVGKAASSVSHN